jgi:asparagine synthase (glutamine-hydrolysing)
MCGIAGVHDPRGGVNTDAPNELLAHRGPDDAGRVQLPHGLSLAMRRLAIIDIAGGQQPMSTPDGRFTIVYNGEVYNAALLRRRMEAAGERFATDHSDTEVVLRLYAKHGEACLDDLNGMFAFAIHDRERETLFCARDHAGIKPFYYFQRDGRFAFASELKALLALPFVSPELDRESLFHYMSLMYVPGERTILRGIRRLPAGHCLTYRLREQEVSIRRWYRPVFAAKQALPREEWRHRVRAGLEAAVERWAISDVPIACSLSGGLDSSSIVGLLAARGRTPDTFSVGFTAPGEEAWNELPLARQVATKWGARHHEIELQPEALLDDLLRMVWHLDEPYGGGLPSWAVFKAMSRSVKVGLTGTGGDELFGNYGKWRELERPPGWPLRRAKNDAENFQRHFFERYYYLPDPDKEERVLNVARSELPWTGAALHRIFEDQAGAGLRDRVAAVDVATQLPEEFLMMTDRFSMAHSLEARTPFLDRELMDMCWSIPADVRTARGDLKGLLREAVADLLPPDVLRAGKRGFVIPLKLWLRDRLRPVVERLLAPDRLARQGVFRAQFHEAYVRPHLEGRADHTNVVWAALMFQLWHHVFLESGARSAPDYPLSALA